MDVIATMRMKTDMVTKIRRWKGLDTDASLALAMGTDPGNLSRVLRGKQAPGAQMIGSLCKALDAEMDDLFEVVPTEDDVA